MEEVFLEDYAASRLFLESQLKNQGNSSSTAGNTMKKGQNSKKANLCLMEKAPPCVTNIIELYNRIESLASEFDV